MRETRRYEMLVRVREFGEAHRDRFPEASAGGEAFAAVAAAAQQFNHHAVAKQRVTQKGTHAKAVARADLEAKLDAIFRTAQALSEDMPDLAERFRRPGRGTVQTLLTTAQVYVQEAEPLQRQFVGHGLAATVLADLQASIDALVQAGSQRDASKAGHASARMSVAAAWESGASAVRKLDAIVANHLQHDPATMAKWEIARRIEPTPRSRTVAKEPVVPSPAGEEVESSAASVERGTLS